MGSENIVEFVRLFARRKREDDKISRDKGEQRAAWHWKHKAFKETHKSTHLPPYLPRDHLPFEQSNSVIE